LPKDYVVSAALPVKQDVLDDCRKQDIAWLLGRLELDESNLEMIGTKPQNQMMPIWSAANSVLSTADKVPLKSVGFLPVLQYDAVYTCMKNLQGILRYLDQPVLPVTCDEGVYRIARETQLIRPNEFTNTILCLGSFHMAKVALGCLGKYLRGSGVESILIESGTFGVNVVESVLNGRNYVRSVKGLQLLKEALSRLQCIEFFQKDSKMEKYKDQLETSHHSCWPLNVVEKLDFRKVKRGQQKTSQKFQEQLWHYD